MAHLDRRKLTTTPHHADNDKSDVAHRKRQPFTQAGRVWRKEEIAFCHRIICYWRPTMEKLPGRQQRVNGSPCTINNNKNNNANHHCRFLYLHFINIYRQQAEMLSIRPLSTAIMTRLGPVNLHLNPDLCALPLHRQLLSVAYLNTETHTTAIKLRERRTISAACVWVLN